MSESGKSVETGNEMVGKWSILGNEERETLKGAGGLENML